jgi:hypothetical protein
MIYITYSACGMPSLKSHPAITGRNRERKGHIRRNSSINVQRKSIVRLLGEKHHSLASLRVLEDKVFYRRADSQAAEV